MQNLKLLSYEAESKVCILAQKYQQLSNKYQQLVNDNKLLKENIKLLEDKIRMQENDIIMYKLGADIKNKQKSTDIKYKINELMREIDTCIHLLNE
ncbi:MAG: hypothetical protein J5701_04605 [Bacteroidales bacterium]|nr:hypothetical protein [Bacteroidales bacterium]